MKKKLIFGIIVLLILFIIAFGYQWIDWSKKEESLIKSSPLVGTPEFKTPPAEVQQVAEEGLPQFLQGLTYDKMALESYGIKSFKEAQSANLGKAYLLYTVKDIAQLANYSQKQKVSVLITPTQTWYFTVLTNNEPRVDLNVSWQEGRWQAVAIGGNLSRAMREMERKMPDLLKAKGITSKCSNKLVKIFSLHATFVFLNCADREFIIPLTPTGWFNLEQGKLYPAEEAIINFTEEAEKTINQPQGLIGH